MIKELITRIAKRYGATLTFSTTTDNFWKYEKTIATLIGFRGFIDKQNCQYDIEDKLRKLNLDYTFTGQFNPDIAKFEWRTTDD